MDAKVSVLVSHQGEEGSLTNEAAALCIANAAALKSDHAFVAVLGNNVDAGGFSPHLQGLDDLSQGHLSQGTHDARRHGGGFSCAAVYLRRQIGQVSEFKVAAAAQRRRWRRRRPFWEQRGRCGSTGVAQLMAFVFVDGSSELGQHHV